MATRPAAVARDELELLLVEHRRDGRQVLVLPQLAVGARRRGGPSRGVAVARGPLASRSRAARAGPRRASSGRRLPRSEGALRAPRRARARPPTMLTPSPRDDDPLDDAPAELLLVVVALARSGSRCGSRARGASRRCGSRRPSRRTTARRRARPAALGGPPGGARWPHVLLEAHVAEVRARAVDRAADAACPAGRAARRGGASARTARAGPRAWPTDTSSRSSSMRASSSRPAARRGTSARGRARRARAGPSRAASAPRGRRGSPRRRPRGPGTAAARRRMRRVIEVSRASGAGSLGPDHARAQARSDARTGRPDRGAQRMKLVPEVADRQVHALELARTRARPRPGSSA